MSLEGLGKGGKGHCLPPLPLAVAASPVRPEALFFSLFLQSRVPVSSSLVGNSKVMSGLR